MKQSSTGYGVALIRAAENLLPEDKLLFEDPYSEKFLSSLYKFLVVLMRSPRIFNFFIKIRGKLTLGIVGGLICRTRYIFSWSFLLSVKAKPPPIYVAGC
jgi:O-methyltransferase involved in polyketide biosynthesis